MNWHGTIRFGVLRRAGAATNVDGVLLGPHCFGWHNESMCSEDAPKKWRDGGGDRVHAE